MGKIVLIGIALLVVVIAGGVLYLMAWDVPVPTGHVERVIPDARFPH